MGGLSGKEPAWQYRRQFQSPGWKDPLEKGIANHSMGSQRVRHDLSIILHQALKKKKTSIFTVDQYLLWLSWWFNIKNLPAMQETRVWSLGGEDPLEKAMATHSSILAGKIPWTEEPGGLHSPWDCKELNMAEHTCMHIFLAVWFKVEAVRAGLTLEVCVHNNEFLLSDP